MDPGRDRKPWATGLLYLLQEAHLKNFCEPFKLCEISCKKKWTVRFFPKSIPSGPSVPPSPPPPPPHHQHCRGVAVIHCFSGEAVLRVETCVSLPKLSARGYKIETEKTAHLKANEEQHIFFFFCKWRDFL